MEARVLTNISCFTTTKQTPRKPKTSIFVIRQHRINHKHRADPHAQKCPPPNLVLSASLPDRGRHNTENTRNFAALRQRRIAETDDRGRTAHDGDVPPPPPFPILLAPSTVCETHLLAVPQNSAPNFSRSSPNETGPFVILARPIARMRTPVRFRADVGPSEGEPSPRTFSSSIAGADEPVRPRTAHVIPLSHACVSTAILETAEARERIRGPRDGSNNGRTPPGNMADDVRSCKAQMGDWAGAT